MITSTISVIFDISKSTTSRQAHGRAVEYHGIGASSPLDCLYSPPCTLHHCGLLPRGYALS
eukprot:COSAG04_NODE_1541_length_6419_cov_3.373259_13_plen_61_part_00